MTSIRINLGKKDSVTDAIAIGGASLSAHMVSPSGDAISTAIVELQGSFDPDKKHWFDFDDLPGRGPVLLASASPALVGIDVRGLLFVRFKVSSPSAAPPAQADLIALMHAQLITPGGPVRRVAFEFNIAVMINGDTTLIAAPAAGRCREGRPIIITNKAANAASITLIKKKGSTSYEVLPTFSLATDESVAFGETEAERILLDDTDESVILNVSPAVGTSNIDVTGAYSEGSL